MTTASNNQKTTWNLDPAHSEIGFKAKHLMITNVSGTFGVFDVQTETIGEDFTTANIRFSADTATIHTGNEQRDAHLRSADFFDSEHFPQLHFESESIEKTAHDKFIIHGNFTIKDVTHPASFHIEFAGIAKDPWGNEKAGFSITGKINRTNWNLNWNAAIEAGGLLVSEEIKLHAEIQLTKANSN